MDIINTNLNYESLFEKIGPICFSFIASECSPTEIWKASNLAALIVEGCNDFSESAGVNAFLQIDFEYLISNEVFEIADEIVAMWSKIVSKCSRNLPILKISLRILESIIEKSNNSYIVNPEKYDKITIYDEKVQFICRIFANSYTDFIYNEGKTMVQEIDELNSNVVRVTGKILKQLVNCSSNQSATLDMKTDIVKMLTTVLIYLLQDEDIIQSIIPIKMELKSQDDVKPSEEKVELFYSIFEQCKHELFEVKQYRSLTHNDNYEKYLTILFHIGVCTCRDFRSFMFAEKSSIYLESYLCRLNDLIKLRTDQSTLSIAQLSFLSIVCVVTHYYEDSLSQLSLSIMKDLSSYLRVSEEDIMEAASSEESSSLIKAIQNSINSL